jgi:hypothetical protein
LIFLYIFTNNYRYFLWNISNISSFQYIILNDLFLKIKIFNLFDLNNNNNTNCKSYLQIFNTGYKTTIIIIIIKKPDQTNANINQLIINFNMNQYIDDDGINSKSKCINFIKKQQQIFRELLMLFFLFFYLRLIINLTSCIFIIKD